jgi:hypothetical protein
MRLLLLVTLILGAPVQAQPEGGGREPGTMRWSRLRAASDEAVLRWFFGEMRIFPYVAHRPDHLSYGQMGTGYSFYSPARPTSTEGVCRTERLSVELQRVGGTFADPVLRPRSSRLVEVFIVENRGDAERGRNRRSAAERERACAALDPRRDGVPAGSAFQLVNAMRLVDRLAEEARSGRLSVPVDCDAAHFFGDPPADEAACLAELGRLNRSGIGWVQDCRPRRAAEGGCTQVLIDRFWIEFNLATGQGMARVTVSGVEDNSELH